MTGKADKISVEEYVPKCPSLHVDVDFELSKPNIVAPSADD